jgi:hypothetical protein
MTSATSITSKEVHCLKGAMVVIDSQMLGRIEKIVDFKTTETTDHIRRHDVPHLD